MAFLAFFFANLSAFDNFGFLGGLGCLGSFFFFLLDVVAATSDEDDDILLLLIDLLMIETKGSASRLARAALRARSSSKRGVDFGSSGVMVAEDDVGGIKLEVGADEESVVVDPG